MKESNLFPDLPRNDSNLDLENQSIDSSILLLSNILHQYPVSNISYRDQERARKEILTQKKQLYRSEIFPRERMASKREREERLPLPSITSSILFANFPRRTAFCRLPVSYRIYRERYQRQQEVTYREGCKSRELRRDERFGHVV